MHSGASSEMTRQHSLRSFVIAIVMAISGGGLWIATDLLFQHAQLSDVSYWLWVVLGAVFAARKLRVGGVLCCAVLALSSFLAVPTLLAMLGLPADFTGWAGVRVMLWIGLPLVLGVYLVAFLIVRSWTSIPTRTRTNNERQSDKQTGKGQTRTRQTRVPFRR